MTRGRSIAWIGLAFALIFDLWLRGHTFGPTLRETIGFAPYFATGERAEPLDCDEAVYAYMGDRIDRGAVLYRDLTENKPPLGYWIYAGAVAIGGMNETAIRIMPIPFVFITITLVWWIGWTTRGPWTALISGFTYAIISTDPYVFGNSANMEFMINAFAMGSLALVIASDGKWRREILLAAGVCLGLAALAKQVAALHGLIYAVVLMLPSSTKERRSVLARTIDVGSLTAGFLLAIAVAAAILWAQGAGPAAIDDIVRFGSAMATDTPPPPNAPSKFIRWFTGNSDPQGKLPWPFGSTDYLVWWGTGTWPIWLAAIPAVGWALFGKGSSRDLKLVASWTVSAWVQVGAPGLFWQHYYLLPLPGIAILVTAFLSSRVERTRQRWSHALPALALATSLFATAWIQFHEYLSVSPEELTIRDKGGRQWVVLRSMGEAIREQTKGWKERPTLFLWGWQSPLFFYGDAISASRQAFADDLTRNFADSEHPFIRPRIDKIMKELNTNLPDLIFTGYPPFPALQAFITRNGYRPSRFSRGLWVKPSRWAEFEAAR